MAIPSLVLLALTLFGVLSPLLTAAHFWQLKEWRWDRLLEHLQREGWVGPLFGKLRPALMLLFGLELLLPGMQQVVWLLSTLGAFAALTIIQIMLGRQPRPVPTRKALALIAGNLVFTVVLSIILMVTGWAIFLPLLVLLQPFLLVFSWIVFRPVDQLLKNRVMDRARTLRAAHPELTVIGVTGSVGKTTTKELIAHVLGPERSAATPAYVNSEMGVAGWLSKTLSDASRKFPEILIVEMGAYRKGEIALLCSIAQPTMGVVTYVGSQHLALFGSQEALAEAKSELIKSLPIDGHAFLNGDNDLSRAMKNVAKCGVTIVGTGGENDLEAFDIAETTQGIKFTTLGSVFEVPLHGTHNITNVLLTIAVAKHLGLDLDTIRRRLATYHPPSRTFAVRDEHGIRILDDTHNSSAASFKAAITWAKSQPYEHKTLLAAGLIEMGEEQERSHAELGALAATIFDDVIFTDSRSATEFEKGFGKTVQIAAAGSEKIPAGSLLVCVGRVSQGIIQRLLP